MKDKILKVLSKNKEIRVFLAKTTDMTECAKVLHSLSKTATAKTAAKKHPKTTFAFRAAKSCALIASRDIPDFWIKQKCISMRDALCFYTSPYIRTSDTHVVASPIRPTTPPALK